MKFYSVRDLRTTPKEMWDDLSSEGEIVVTNNGKPTAVMIDLNGADFEGVISAVRQAGAMMALNKLQLESVLHGLGRLSLEDINKEINAARDEMKAAEYAPCR